MAVRTLEHYFIVTGGPGAGKSTLLDELAGRGHPHLPEGARAIVRAHAGLGSPVRDDPSLFGELMLSWEMRSYEQAATMDGPVFSDRGIGELVSFFADQVGHVPDHVWRAAREWRYAETVFIAPPWPEIYRTDDERVQTVEFTASIFPPLEAVYRQLGYDVVVLPRTTPAERADFVLSTIRGRP